MSDPKYPSRFFASHRVVKESSAGTQIIELELTPEAREMLTIRPRNDKQRT